MDRNNDRPKGPPPAHKMAVVMGVAVYPTITILLWLTAPLIGHLPLPVRTLILTVLMVPVMIWFVVPKVTALFGPWLMGRPLMTTLVAAITARLGAPARAGRP